MKRDEQSLKGRNITNRLPDPASGELAKGISLTLHEILIGLSISDPHLCFQASQAARKMQSWERNPLLKPIVEAELIPRLVAVLKSSLQCCLPLEAAWALSNIAAGPLEQTRRGCVEGVGT